MKRFVLAAAIAAAFVGVAHAKVTELQVFRDPDFRGPADTIKGEVNVLEHGLGRQVSSVIAKGGAWEVCTGDHFTGRCRVLREGEYPTLGRLNDKIMSVRFLGDNPRFAREETRREPSSRQDYARQDYDTQWHQYYDSRRPWDSPRYEADRTPTYR